MAKIREAALSRALTAGVSGLLLAGVDRAGWSDEAAIYLAHRHELDIALAYGVHPQIVIDLDDAELDAELAALSRALRGQEAALPKPHAVGELGLDGLAAEWRLTLPRQERAFRAQLALARELDLPIVLHILRTHGEALRILKADGLPARGGVVHSYSGSAELVADYLALGLHISFAGSVTYANARRLREAAQKVPLMRLLVETDAPDQTPLLRRPQQNEPAFLIDVLEALAIIRSTPITTLAQATAENARRLFGLQDKEVSR